MNINRTALIGSLALLLSACGSSSSDSSTASTSGTGSSTSTPSTYTVGGSVTGLSQGTSVVLNNIGGGNQTVMTDGNFSVASSASSGTAYSVSVATQPTGENCSVSNGAGTVGSANVTNISVACASATAPPSSGSPTATFSSSTSDATNLSTLVLPAANSLVQASSSSSLPALGVLITPPNGVTSNTTVNCTLGGTATETVSIANPSVGISAGDSVAIAFSNCSYTQGEVINGSATVTYTSYTNAENFVLSYSGSNLSVVLSGTSYGPFSYTGTITDVNGTISWTYDVNGATVAGTPVVTTTGTTATITSGTLNVNYGSGWVTVTFSNWSYDLTTGLPTSGTCTITGSDGNSATVTVTSTGYDVTLDISGTTTSYVIPF